MLSTASRVPSACSACRCASTSPVVWKLPAVHPLGRSGRASQRKNGECTSINCRFDSVRSSVSLLRVTQTGETNNHKAHAHGKHYAVEQEGQRREHHKHNTGPNALIVLLRLRPLRALAARLRKLLRAAQALLTLKTSALLILVQVCDGDDGEPDQVGGHNERDRPHERLVRRRQRVVQPVRRAEAAARVLLHDVRPHLHQSNFPRETKTKERRKRNAGADLSRGAVEAVVRFGEFAQSDCLKERIRGKRRHVHAHARVHGAEGGGATRSHHAHGDDHGCNGDAGEQGDEQVVVDGGDVGGSGRGPTRGGTELEAGGQGTLQAGSLLSFRLKLKHFAGARRDASSWAEISGRTKRTNIAKRHILGGEVTT